MKTEGLKPYIKTPALFQVSYTNDDAGIPPAWLGQDVVAIDPTLGVALVVPRTNTAHWCAQTGSEYKKVTVAECPRPFGRCAVIEWNECDGLFEIFALREPIGPTVDEAPNFGLGRTPDAHSFWGLSEFTPEGITIRYQLSEPLADGTFFPMPVCEATLPNVEEARAYMTEVIRNIDIVGLGLCGFAHV